MSGGQDPPRSRARGDFAAGRGLVDRLIADRQPGRQRARDGNQKPSGLRRRNPPRSRHLGQYTSWAFTRRAHDSGLVPSMGSIGNCYDSGQVTSSWARMQVELVAPAEWRAFEVDPRCSAAGFEFCDGVIVARGVELRR